MLYRELVLTHRWMSDAEFAQAYAIEQLAPGPSMLMPVYVATTWLAWRELGPPSSASSPFPRRSAQSSAAGGPVTPTRPGPVPSSVASLRWRLVCCLAGLDGCQRRAHGWHDIASRLLATLLVLRTAASIPVFVIALSGAAGLLFFR